MTTAVKRKQPDATPRRLIDILCAADAQRRANEEHARLVAEAHKPLCAQVHGMGYTVQLYGNVERGIEVHVSRTDGEGVLLVHRLSEEEILLEKPSELFDSEAKPLFRPRAELYRRRYEWLRASQYEFREAFGVVYLKAWPKGQDENDTWWTAFRIGPVLEQ